jgi:hypothetical protein
LKFCPDALLTIEKKKNSLQIYYFEYYGKYLEEYEKRKILDSMNDGGSVTTTTSSTTTTASSTAPSSMDSSLASVTPLEASILMDDIMNNGMTFCSIM